MKLKVNLDAMESVMYMLSKVVNPRNTLPILCNVLCEAKDGQLTMTASDGEVTLRGVVALDEQDGDGRFCVSAAWLADALMQSPPQRATIVVTDTRFTIQRSTGETFFPIESADAYPTIKAGDYNTQLSLNARTVRDALKRSVWSTANDTLRLVLNGICFNLTDEWLDIVASDGHTLVRKRVFGSKSSGEAQFIVPKKAANVLADLLDGDDELEIEVNARMCEVGRGAFTLSFRLVEGRYPNYNAIIPKESKCHANMNIEEAIGAIRRVMPFAGDAFDSKLLRLDICDGQLEMSGDDLDMETGSRDRMHAEFDGEPMTIGINGVHMLNILQRLVGENCIMGITDSDRPVIFEYTDPTDESKVTMLAMPMMLHD